MTTPSPEALAAASYMAQHNWLRDGVAVEQVASIIDRERPARTPNAALPPLDPITPTRKLLVEMNVPVNWEKRLDMQWVLEREINADRWLWEWAEPAKVA